MSNIRTPNIPGFIPQTRAPQTRFPQGATDCHAHVFGPQERFPYLPGAAYIPPDAVTTDYVAMLKNNGCDRGVLVQPSVYGDDNACLLDALRTALRASSDAETRQLALLGLTAAADRDSATIAIARQPSVCARIVISMRLTSGW